MEFCKVFPYIIIITKNFFNKSIDKFFLCAILIIEREVITMWEANAKIVEQVYGGHVDWEERFYECPECGEPIYECDWSLSQLLRELCPVCGFKDED